MIINFVLVSLLIQVPHSSSLIHSPLSAHLCTATSVTTAHAYNRTPLLARPQYVVSSASSPSQHPIPQLCTVAAQGHGYSPIRVPHPGISTSCGACISCDVDPHHLQRRALPGMLNTVEASVEHIPPPMMFQKSAIDAQQTALSLHQQKPLHNLPQMDMIHCTPHPTAYVHLKTLGEAHPSSGVLSQSNLPCRQCVQVSVPSSSLGYVAAQFRPLANARDRRTMPTPQTSPPSSSNVRSSSRSESGTHHKGNREVVSEALRSRGATVSDNSRGTVDENNTQCQGTVYLNTTNGDKQKCTDQEAEQPLLDDENLTESSV